MRGKTLLIGVAALVVALAAATAAFAATQHVGSGTARRATLTAASTPAPAGTAQPRACRALMSDPVAWKDMQALPSQHQADMKSWLQQYGSDPTSAAARAALAKLRTEHWNDMRALLQKYGVNTGTGGPGSMMGGSRSGSGYRGMMGGAGYGSAGGMMGSY